MQSLSIVPEHDLIVSGDFDGKVLGTSRQSGAIVLSHEHPSRAAVVCLRPDVSHERLLVVSTYSWYWLSLKDFTLQSEHVFNDGGWGRTCDFDSIHQRLLLGRQDGQVELLNTDNDHAESLRSGGTDEFPPALTFSPDGALVAMSDSLGMVTVRELKTGKDIWSVSLPERVRVLSLAYNLDGSILAGGDSEGWVRTWNGKTGQPGQARPAQTGPVWQVGFTRGHPAGEYLAVAGNGGEISWFEIKSFLPTPPTRVHNGRINALAFGNDGTYASGANDKAVAYFSPFVTNYRVRSIGAPIADLTRSPDGSKIAVVAGAKGLLGFYSSATLEPLGEAFETGATILTVALSLQGNRVALGSADGRLLLLQGLEPNASKVWSQAHEGALLKAVFSPNGTKLYTLGDDHRLIVWLVGADGVSSPRTLSTEALRSLALNTEGTRLAAGSMSGGIMIIDPESGNIIVKVDRNPSLAMTAIAYHPHRSQLFVGDAYGYLHLFDTEKNQFVWEPKKGQQGEITGIVTVPIDDSVYTSSRDGTLRQWDIRSGGEPVGTPMSGTQGAIRALAIDESGKLLVSGGGDGKLAVRHIDPENWLQEGCERFGRRFTPEERLRFGLDKYWPEPCPQ